MEKYSHAIGSPKLPPSHPGGQGKSWGDRSLGLLAEILPYPALSSRKALLLQLTPVQRMESWLGYHLLALALYAYGVLLANF